MKPLRKKDITWLALLLAAGIITYISIEIGMQQASSGQLVAIWLHALLFILSIALVFVAIIVKLKNK